jgi:hypothetical protein
LDAGNGSVRMGSHVAKATVGSVNAGGNSAVNFDVDTLGVAKRLW